MSAFFAEEMRDNIDSNLLGGHFCCSAHQQSIIAGVCLAARHRPQSTILSDVWSRAIGKQRSTRQSFLDSATSTRCPWGSSATINVSASPVHETLTINHKNQGLLKRISRALACSVFLLRLRRSKVAVAVSRRCSTSSLSSVQGRADTPVHVQRMAPDH